MSSSSRDPDSGSQNQNGGNSTAPERRISVGTGLDKLLRNLGATNTSQPDASSETSAVMSSADGIMQRQQQQQQRQQQPPRVARPAGPRPPAFVDTTIAKKSKPREPYIATATRSSVPTAAQQADGGAARARSSTDPAVNAALASYASRRATASSQPTLTTHQLNEMAKRRMTTMNGGGGGGGSGSGTEATRTESRLIPRISLAELNELPSVSLPGFTPHSSSRRPSDNKMLDPQSAAAWDREKGQSGAAMTRKRSLIRPERDRRSRQPRQDLLTAGGISAGSSQTYLASGGRGKKADQQDFSRYYRNKWTPWTVFARLVTFYAPNAVLRCFGMRDARVQEAWREKMGLVTIIFWMCVLLGFITFGFQYVTCIMGEPQKFLFRDGNANVVNIRGDLYDISTFTHPGKTNVQDVAGKDVSWLFPLYPEMMSGQSACSLVPDAKNVTISCTVDGTDLTGYCHTVDQASQMLNQLNIIGKQSYDWSDIEGSDRYIVFNGMVLDLDRYFKEGNQFLGGTDFENLLVQNSGHDVTRLFTSTDDLKLRMNCLQERFRVGVVNQDSAGCLASQVFMWTSLIVILAVILIKFVIAVFFNWTMSRKLGKALPPPPDYSEEADAGKNRVAGGTRGMDTASKRGSMMLPMSSRYSQQYNSHSNYSNSAGSIRAQATRTISGRPQSMIAGRLSPPQSTATAGPMHLSAENIAGIDPSGILRTILLVTCYSEGEASLRTTLDSLARTTFPDTHKMLFIIADGIITGRGNAKSTADILVDMIELDPQFDTTPEPYSYVAIADGTKRHNMARVYAGRYHVEGHTVPTVLVVKCGTPEEQKDPKPGNRGKRDSQVLLMQFLSKCMFDDRMTTLEFDMFTKITAVSSCYDGLTLDMLTERVTPDLYELVLMVDADTKVMPDALTAMSWTMANDPRISGLCGETRIANKSTSWVTAMQVFEYHISHFLSKSFESVFGCVTCLPGCFCMYRIKAPKGPVNADGTQFYVPILANPDIVEQYSENVVDTLHKKNLLLLGEDRYLTTLMLKTFPKRKMVFVPRAVCKTVVPDTFKVLLSQRRRWINSTVHNLLELVQIRDLCGIFCFSMQFVIFMELVGTAVLPAAIAFTLYLLVISFLMTPVPVIPLVLLALILGLPAILILITSKRWVYIVWMAVYLVSLPIWNFVLPVYAYWHFDDFSWGETRQVAGPAGSDGHGADKQGVFDSSKIVMKQWSEFERERRRAAGAIASPTKTA